MHVLMMVMLRLMLLLLMRAARARLMMTAETRLYHRQRQATKRQSY
jgi:hypothetical protein